REGVRTVGGVFRGSFDSLGFTTTGAAVPDAVGRAGHLVAEHRGKPGAVRMLLIGHLDTVVEPAGANFVREDSIARAIGGADMKGGDVVILYALKALQAAGALRDLNITIVFTGDEEHPGEPLADARRALIDAAQHSIVAQHLPGTDATIVFRDEYPAMSPTPGNARLLAVYDSASKALGYGAVAALDPGRRGAGDISFVAPLIDGLDGLGAMGGGTHAPGERVDLRTLGMQTERAALLLYRLGPRPAA